MMINKIHRPRTTPPNYDKQNCRTMTPLHPSRPHHHHHHHELGKFPPSSICPRDFWIELFAQIQTLHFSKSRAHQTRATPTAIL